MAEAVDLLVARDEVGAGRVGVVEEHAARPREGVEGDGRPRLGRGGDEERRAERRRRREVCADEPRQSHRALDVEAAHALLEVVEARERLRRVHQKRLDQIRREPRVGLQDQRRRARDRRRRHRGAAQAHHAARLRPAHARVEFGVLCDEQVVRRLGRDELVARRDQFGLDEVVVVLRAERVRPVAARRPARAVGGHSVVAARVGAEGVRRADGDDRGLDAGRMNAAVDLTPRGVLALVARGGHDDHPRIDELARGLAERVVAVRVNGRGAQGEVDDADVVGRAVRQHPVERGEQPRGRARAARAQHAQVDDVGVRGDARVRAVRDTTVARRHARHVRAVPEGVGGRPLTSEVNAPDDARAARLVEERLVAGVDAGVYDGDADARAVERRRSARLSAHGVGAGRGREVAEQTDGPVCGDEGDERAGREEKDVARGDVQRAHVEVLVGARGARPEGLK